MLAAKPAGPPPTMSTSNGMDSRASSLAELLLLLLLLKEQLSLVAAKEEHTPKDLFLVVALSGAAGRRMDRETSDKNRIDDDGILLLVGRFSQMKDCFEQWIVQGMNGREVEREEERKELVIV